MSNSQNPSAIKTNKTVQNLIRVCESGDQEELENIINENDFSCNTYNGVLRLMLDKYDSQNESIISCIDTLLGKHVDLNSQLGDSENNSLLMLICTKGDLDLIKKIIKSAFERITVNPKIIPIKFDLVDNHKRNFIHHIFYGNYNEEDAIIIFNYFVNDFLNEFYGETEKDGIYNTIHKLMKNKDEEGKTPLNYILLKGWFRITEIYLDDDEYEPNIDDDGNNYLHTAVLGRSFNCVKAILIRSNLGDMQMKNKDDLTPCELARDNKCLVIAKIIQNFEYNINDSVYVNCYSNYKEELLIDKEEITINRDQINTNLILDDFRYKRYDIVYNYLTLLNIYHNIQNSFLSQSSPNNYNNICRGKPSLSIEWNLLLTNYKIFLETKGKNPKYFSSKVIVKRDFEKYFLFIKEEKIIEYSNEVNNRDIYLFPPIDIIIFNEIVYCLKIFDYERALKNILLYIKKVLPINIGGYYKGVVIINIIIISILILIKHKYEDVAKYMIIIIEGFLFKLYSEKKDIVIKDLDNIYSYLNDMFLMNFSTESWDEFFCFTNLMKYNCELETDKNKSNLEKYLNDFNTLYTNCKYLNELKIFGRFIVMKRALKIKKCYSENSTVCYNKLQKLYSNTKKESYDIEAKIFYYNSLGIVNMKQKKYLSAEFQFKCAINLIKKHLEYLKANQKYVKNFLDNTANIRINRLNYNLGLVLFFQKKYSEAYKLFSTLRNAKEFQWNFFLFYRLGLCQLEMDLLNKEKYNEDYNDLLSNISKQYKTKENEAEQFSFDLTEEIFCKDPKETQSNTIQNHNNENLKEEYDELYFQFENGYIKNKLAKKKQNSKSNYSSNESKTLDSTTDSKRGNLSEDQSIQKGLDYFIISCLNHTKSTERKSQYLIEAIKYFKKVIMIFSKDTLPKELLEDVVYNITKLLDSKDIKKTKISYPYSNYKIQFSFVLIGSYLNLFFCLSLTEEWNELLFYLRHFEDFTYSKKIEISMEVRVKIEFFRVEAYLRMGKIEQAEKVIQDIEDKYDVTKYNLSFYQRENQKIYQNLSLKIVVDYLNALILIQKNNFTKAETLLKNIKEEVEEDIPSFLFHGFIFLNIQASNCSEFNERKRRKFLMNILSIIKNREIKNSFDEESLRKDSEF
ncbi:MAG: ankyrin repeat domain-containing protein [archaeon]|nr:ankyrin repeat domain-containing protein [archaeon]